ncbi:MAG: hypothetical protein J6Z22_04620 [Lachnospiraceae bacterium]|nr:hypothetical protein [Lachnospiraceae bacterium]
MSVIALTYMVAAMEKKLRELMGDEEYRKFAAKVAKGAFEAEICALKERGFKGFCLDDFDEIVEEDDD